ncbi:DUF397 domain-containing protein [Streptomyces sp. NPDC005492]|uniref:DUF397 domain-containing protein n=1 Tax=Streptomyces sp. NPDC005492 TaxID=3156883 RepID=UPI0033A5629C
MPQPKRRRGESPPKSPYSGGSSNGVEMATTPSTVHIRDPKNPTGPEGVSLAFPAPAASPRGARRTRS